MANLLSFCSLYHVMCLDFTDILALDIEVHYPLPSKFPQIQSQSIYYLDSMPPDPLVLAC